MFNLILKDILIQKKTFLFGAVYIMIIILSFQQIGSPMVPASIIALTYVMTQYACAYDDKNKADMLLNSLPLGRDTVVAARYLSTFVFLAIAVVYYIVLAGIISVLRLPVRVYPVSFEDIAGCLFSSIVMTSIYFPVFFKVGYIKSRMVNFVLFYGLFFVGGMLVPELVKDKNSELAKWTTRLFSNQWDVHIIAGAFIITILFLSASYMLSLKFYRNREF